MKSVYIKNTRSGNVQPANPYFKDYGEHVQTYRVDSVPDDVTPGTVAGILRQVAIWPVSSCNLSQPEAWVINWEQIKNAKPGAIIRTGK